MKKQSKKIFLLSLLLVIGGGFNCSYGQLPSGFMKNCEYVRNPEWRTVEEWDEVVRELGEVKLLMALLLENYDETATISSEHIKIVEKLTCIGDKLEKGGYLYQSIEILIDGLRSLAVANLAQLQVYRTDLDVCRNVITKDFADVSGIEMIVFIFSQVIDLIDDMIVKERKDHIVSGKPWYLEADTVRFCTDAKSSW